MSVLPVVSIIGRPNVGKSSLFNRILQKKVAVVDNAPGVTRDRNYKETIWNRCRFVIVDTGGLIPISQESIPVEINKQVDIAIKESSVILFLVDAQSGPTDLDMLIAKKLRKSCLEKVIVTANKAESQTASLEVERHLSLGCGDPTPISALHGKGVGDLLDKICTYLHKLSIKKSDIQKEFDLIVTVIGRPNAGKSSFVNKLLLADRMIVDIIPFTTRDAIDSVFQYKEFAIKIIDTAGLRKKSHVHKDIEYYSNLRALESVKYCDVCVLLIDTTKGLEEQDLKILYHISQLKKGVVICFNKWDIVEKGPKTFDRLISGYKKTYRIIQHIPIVSLSALTGQRVTTVIDIALQVKEKMTKRIKPSELRDAVFTWTTTNPHPFISSKQVRFLGVKQYRAHYPHFIFYCTNSNNIVSSYNRFLINKLHDTFDFSGCPIILSYKPVGKFHKD